VARLFTGLGWFFAFATVGSLIAGELSDDPEYYVPVIAASIAASIAAASLLLAGPLRRRHDRSLHR